MPGPRRPDVPLFILTDDVTRSAAEDATFVLQNMHRATVVGDTTAGAGRMVAGFPLGHGIMGAVSFTRVMEPGTRREWERVGIIPDIPTSRDSALAVAHREALRRLIAAAHDDATRRELQRTLQGVEARNAALTRSAEQLRPAPELAQYVGTYEGDQTVEIVHASLVYQPRVAQPRQVLSPLGNGLFAWGSARYRFTVNGTSTTLAVLGPDGSWSSFARVSRTVAPRRR